MYNPGFITKIGSDRKSTAVKVVKSTRLLEYELREGFPNRAFSLFKEPDLKQK